MLPFAKLVTSLTECLLFSFSKFRFYCSNFYNINRTDVLLCFSGGQLAAFCRAGFWCLSGAKSDIPVTTTIFEDCLPGDECAGMCPTGHYCENGTLVPTPCPELTYRNETGGQQLSDCSICPAGYICQNGKKTSLVHILCTLLHDLEAKVTELKF